MADVTREAGVYSGVKSSKQPLIQYKHTGSPLKFEDSNAPRKSRYLCLFVFESILVVLQFLDIFGFGHEEHIDAQPAYISWFK